MNNARQEVVVYVPPDGTAQVEVRLDQETVWLTQGEIGQVFGVTRENVNMHLRQIYREGELEREATCKEDLQVRQEGAREVRRKTLAYNLDAILSVGYRINSKRGTHFRQWATRVLKERLAQDFRQRKRLEGEGIRDMQETLRLAQDALNSRHPATDEAKGMLRVIERYARSWSLLLQYDERRLPEQPARPSRKIARLTLAQARRAIARLQRDLRAKGEASDLFGQERGDALAGILATIEQSFGGELLYPSVEVRAANLLYFLIKDHPFTDGNKRIGSLLFLLYLDKNGRLLRPDGLLRFDDNALVALALLIAESKPAERDLMVRLILGLLEDASAAA
jgi:prophage maintenance system killer protein